MAAKRHHSSHKKTGSMPMPDTVHGSYKSSSHEMYAGPSQSKRMMSMDGGMIREDWNATALLPTHVIDRDWPKARNYGLNGEGVGDLFSEANRQLSSNNASMDEEKDFTHY